MVKGPRSFRIRNVYRSNGNYGANKLNRGINMFAYANVILPNYKMFLLAHFISRRIKNLYEEAVWLAIEKKSEKSDRKKAVDWLVNEIKTDGFFILESALPSNLVDPMEQEFESLMATTSQNYHSLTEHEGAKCFSIKPFFSLRNLNNFQNGLALFSNSLFRNVAESFYERKIRRINHISEVFFHNTLESNKPLSDDFHWDRSQTLKFWLYLNDIGSKNGATKVEKGSVSRNRSTRLLAGAPDTLVGGVDNIANVEGEIVSLTAPRGSIVFLDTDCTHAASPVSQGQCRKIIRGHTRLV